MRICDFPKSSMEHGRAWMGLPHAAYRVCLSPFTQEERPSHRQSPMNNSEVVKDTLALEETLNLIQSAFMFTDAEKSLRKAKLAAQELTANTPQRLSLIHI